MAILKLLKKLLKLLLKSLIKSLEAIFRLLKKATQYFSKLVSKLKWKSFFIGLFTLFGSWWAYYTYYYPEVSITYTNPIVSTDILTSRFTIENNGNSNIYDVYINYEIKNIKVKYEKGGISQVSGLKVISNWQKKMIAMKKKQVINIDIFKEIFSFIPNESDEKIYTIDANLEIQLNYIYWNNRIKTDTFRFITQYSETNKSIIWLNNQ